ncbi:MAG TPA: hypothetical protein VKZ59_11355 [Acidobacteriota bacterium]|nr:hypothetical protein [Acidobacteriota bacterium]
MKDVEVEQVQSLEPHNRMRSFYPILGSEIHTVKRFVRPATELLLSRPLVPQIDDKASTEARGTR